MIETPITSTTASSQPPTNTISITDDNMNISLDMPSSTQPNKEEKTTFERAIIEAFKQRAPCDIYKNLTIAYDEIKYLLEEIKLSKGTKYILNKNLLDKLSRITERRYFNINILIAKIYEHLLDTNNFEYLSNDINLLITFANETLNMLDIVKSTSICRYLENKISCFLGYLHKTPSLDLDPEQKETIQELINAFPTRNNSDSYKNFPAMKENIIALCKSENPQNKLDGLFMLMEAFGDAYSLDEQFDLLLEHCPTIIKAIINQPNPENQEVYFQLGNFIVTLLYSYKYVVKAERSNNDVVSQQQQSSKVRSFFISDPPFAKIPAKENDYNHLSFLNGVQFELTNQKDLLLKSENIFSICNLIINTLSIYESIFQLQYACFLILKKVYFIFPQFRNKIEEVLASTLINMCAFKQPDERTGTIEPRQFLHYILSYSNEESLKEQIQRRITAKGNTIDTTLEKEYGYELKDVEYEVLNFGYFNLRVGYPNYYSVEAGAQYERYVEVDHPNSLVYIGFTTNVYDITCHILKYVQQESQTGMNNVDEELTDKGHFVEIFKLEKIDCSDVPVKVVVFVRESGIYKLCFDNSYSWFTPKVVRHRLSVLKAISEVNVEKGKNDAKEEEMINKQNEKVMLMENNNSNNNKQQKVEINENGGNEQGYNV